MGDAIAIGADHAGYELKDRIKKLLAGKGFEVEDMGTNGPDSVDYPDYAHAVAAWVAKTGNRGILICGTGIGMCISANKVHGVRAALCHDEFTAEMARKHNDANVLCVGARTTAPDLAEKIVSIFLSTNFEGGRHERRVNKMEPGDSC